MSWVIGENVTLRQSVYLASPGLQWLQMPKTMLMPHLCLENEPWPDRSFLNDLK